MVEFCDEMDLLNEGASVINNSRTTPYAFTLRKTTKASLSSKSDYNKKLQRFEDLGVHITDRVYEKNETNTGIHCHGVMQVPKKFNFKKFRTRGWRIQLDEIYDYAGWLCYMTKQNTLESIPLFDEDEPIEAIAMPKSRLF